MQGVHRVRRRGHARASVPEVKGAFGLAVTPSNRFPTCLLGVLRTDELGPMNVEAIAPSLFFCFPIAAFVSLSP